MGASFIRDTSRRLLNDGEQLFDWRPIRRTDAHVMKPHRSIGADQHIASELQNIPGYPP